MESKNNQVGFRITDTLKIAIEAANRNSYSTISSWIESVITNALIEAGYVKIIPQRFGMSEMVLTDKCQQPTRKRGRRKKVSEIDKEYIEAKWKAQQLDVLVESLNRSGFKIQLPEKSSKMFSE